MKRTLGDRVKEQRVLQGISVQQLARRANVSASYIYAIESGERGSHIDKITRIARALDVPLIEIWPYDTGIENE